jgi:hypothetical protein
MIYYQQLIHYERWYTNIMIHAYYVVNMKQETISLDAQHRRELTGDNNIYVPYGKDWKQ